MTYAAYTGETPVLSGGRRIGGWKPTRVNGRAAWFADVADLERLSMHFPDVRVLGV